jgi:putative endonuclease
MLKTTRSRGKHAEGLARRYLQNQGLKFVLSNFEKPYGEIDLVMRDQGIWVFTEVRARENFTHGHPFETVTKAKQQRIIRVARQFLLEHADIDTSECRFDIVAVNLKDDSIEWLQDAFEA